MTRHRTEPPFAIGGCSPGVLAKLAHLGRADILAAIIAAAGVVDWPARDIARVRAWLGAVGCDAAWPARGATIANKR